MLTYEHTNTNAGHVEAVEEGLDVRINLHALPIPFIFENALGDGRDDAVVPALDVLKSLCEALVVVIQFGGPIVAVVGRGVVSARGGGAFAIAVAVVLAGSILALFYAGVLGRVA